MKWFAKAGRFDKVLSDNAFTILLLIAVRDSESSISGSNPGSPVWFETLSSLVLVLTCDSVEAQSSKRWFS